ncbi:MAG TPA: PIN domain nuclease [Polyangia bacterium]|jgi:Predicted nucleic acid-binding protein, contains PIN domain|nr:PIN domain nuclease [Polyangia bacterium]
MLVDTSAWIEWLRATGSRPDRILPRAFERGDPIFVTGVVVQEILNGARDERHVAQLQQLLATCHGLEPVYPETYQHAAHLFRTCRAAGRSVRGTLDCLIAAIALEHSVELLAHDRDFETLSDVCGLRLRVSA